MPRTFDKYKSLWPESSWPKIQPLFEKVEIQEGIPKGMVLPKNHSLLIVEQKTPLEVLQLIEDGYPCVIQKSRPDFSFELLAGLLLMTKPEAFVTNPIPFFIRDEGAKVVDVELRNEIIEFNSTSEKEGLLERVFEALSGVPSHIQESAMTAADELIMNALFHGPVDFEGRKMFDQYDRSREVTLPRGTFCAFFFKVSSRQILIGVRDPFGTMVKAPVVQRLKELYESTEPVYVSASRKGAKMGLKMVMERSSSLYVFQSRAKHTLVCAQIDLLKTRRQAEGMPKNLLLSFGI